MKVISIPATFAVAAGAFRIVDVDVEGKSLDEIGAAIERAAEEPRLCQSCSHDMSEPTLQDCTGFTLDGVEYAQRGGAWVPAR